MQNISMGAHTPMKKDKATEYRNQNPSPVKLAPLAIAGIAALPGVIQGIGGLIGGRRRRKQRDADRAAFEQQYDQFANTQFVDQFRGLENPFEDATVNLQAAEFEQQQLDRNLAQILEAQRQSGGPINAQAIGNLLLEGRQQISNKIRQEEQANQTRSLQYGAQLDQLKASSRDELASRQYHHGQSLLNLRANQARGSQQAYQQGRQQAIGGFANALSSGIGAFAGAGGFGGGAGAAGGAGGGGGFGQFLGGSAPQLGYNNALPQFGSLVSKKKTDKGHKAFLNKRQQEFDARYAHDPQIMRAIAESDLHLATVQNDKTPIMDKLRARREDKFKQQFSPADRAMLKKMY